MDRHRQISRRSIIPQGPSGARLEQPLEGKSGGNRTARQTVMKGTLNDGKIYQKAFTGTLSSSRTYFNGATPFRGCIFKYSGAIFVINLEGINK